MRRLLPQLLLFLLLSQIQLHGSHALVRGHRHERTGVVTIPQRFLGDEKNNDPNDPNKETAQPSREPPPAPVTVAPATPPMSPVDLESQTPATVSPVAEENGKLYPTTAPIISPDSSSPVVVNLSSFVVSAESTASQDEDVTASLEAFLTKQLKKEFDSLITVDLTLQTRKLQSGRRTQASNELAYTGTASFDSEVSDQAVRDAQRAVLQDSATVQEAVPSVTSIQIAADDNGATSAPESSTSSGTSMALTIGVSIVAAVAVLVAAYFAYRYYSTPPPPPPPPLASKDASKRVPRSSSIPKSLYTSDDAGSQSASGYFTGDGRSIEIDDYSLDGFSATGSEAGLDKTELYLLQRYKAKKERDHQQSLMANPNLPPSDYYFNNNNHDDGGDESDAGFSYDHVGRKEAESDDDLYTTTSSAIEVSLDGSATFMTGYFGALGRGNRNGTNSTKAAAKKKSTSTTPATKAPTTAAVTSTTATRGKRAVNEIPFDESSVDRPFDEMPPVKKALPAPASIRAGEQARVIANQVQHDRDNGNIDSDEDYPVGRTRSGNSRKSADSDKEDLSSFLRDRRQAKRAARKSRELRKQPPVSMEV